MNTALSISISILLALSACQSEQVFNIPEENPDSPISYQNQIQPIFNTSCGGTGCHINNRRSGVNLTTYTQTMNSTGSAYGRDIVIAGDADTSPLADILGPDPSASRRMPLNASPLTAEEISLIRSWINQGALNN